MAKVKIFHYLHAIFLRFLLHFMLSNGNFLLVNQIQTQMKGKIILFLILTNLSIISSFTDSNRTKRKNRHVRCFWQRIDCWWLCSAIRKRKSNKVSLLENGSYRHKIYSYLVFQLCSFVFSGISIVQIVWKVAPHSISCLSLIQAKRLPFG